MTEQLKASLVSWQLGAMDCTWSVTYDSYLMRGEDEREMKNAFLYLLQSPNLVQKEHDISLQSFADSYPQHQSRGIIIK